MPLFFDLNNFRTLGQKAKKNRSFFGSNENKLGLYWSALYWNQQTFREISADLMNPILESTNLIIIK